jgi:uncharacterized membrane protein
MSEGDYELKPPAPAPPPPKTVEPGWVPPTPVIEKADPAEAVAPECDPDIEQHRGLAVLAYICFLVPPILAPNSRFARFHANQGLLLFITLVVVVTLVVVLHLGAWLVGILFTNIALLDYFFSAGFHLLQVALLAGWVALMIYGIIQAANGLSKPLPAIGHWTLIK